MEDGAPRDDIEGAVGKGQCFGVTPNKACRLPDLTDRQGEELRREVERDQSASRKRHAARKFARAAAELEHPRSESDATAGH